MVRIGLVSSLILILALSGGGQSYASRAQSSLNPWPTSSEAAGLNRQASYRTGGALSSPEQDFLFGLTVTAVGLGSLLFRKRRGGDFYMGG